MRVNSFFTRFFNNQFTVGLGFALVLTGIFLIASSFTKHPGRELRSKQTNLIIRQLGHQLLLLSGDSTSRVLPVTENKEGTFLLQFENEFAFSHDSLIMLAQKLLSKTQFPSGYVVTVHECTKTTITYGFQITQNTDLLACKGRNQPRGCYSIEIVFPDLYDAPFDYPVTNLAYSGMLLLLGFTLVIGRFKKIVKTAATQNQSVVTVIDQPTLEQPALGKFLFDVKNQRLLSGTEVINLTDKECRVLELLNENFGELIPRETLMEKVWISEGVLTGRSLDMFVSKLRKKLSGDPALRITNVHGKGYKLEIVTP
jgi:hypothetical protein